MTEENIKPAVDVGSFQSRVNPWLLACFGSEIASDKIERNHRFLEESLELVQSLGCTTSEAHQIVEYVYGRPVGDPSQEVGGVMVTLAALCLASSLDMHANGETELARIWTKVEKIRAKQAAKPKHSPLPECVPAVEVEPVATIGRDYQLLWVGSGPLAQIVWKHGLKVGSMLYAHAPDSVARIAELETSLNGEKESALAYRQEAIEAQKRVAELESEVRILKETKENIWSGLKAKEAENAALKADAERFKAIADMWLWETVNERKEHADARRLTQVAFKESVAAMGAK